MAADEINNSAADDAGELTGPEPLPVEPAESEAESAFKLSWTRRAFFQAAALGAAAAAFLDGKRILPSIAWANDLSGNPCTAQDVEIIGTGVVQNEPCSCTPGGTFTAHVQFTVRNNTSTGRYCICLHLPDGFGVPGQDVILRDSSGSSTASGKSDTVMFGDIAGFPCNSGGSLVCIGQQGVTTGKCASNTCTTIAWNTSTGAAGCSSCDQKPPGGQCRHQGICIQGYGAGLTCSSGCTPTCGGSSVLTATVSGGASPYTYTLAGNDGSSQTFPLLPASTTATSHDFTVTVKQNTTYTLTVTDAQGCSRTAQVSLSASPLTPPSGSAGTVDCSGNVTLTASPSGLASYTWLEGSTQLGTTNPLTVQLAPGNHTVRVTVTNSAGCPATSAGIPVNVNQPVSASASAGTPNCAGQVTLTATPSGGAGGYSYKWFDGTNTTPIGTTNPLTTTLTPGDHSITVEVKDSAGCTKTSDPTNVHVNQPASVSASAGTPDCSGSVTLTASASGGAGGYSYKWFDGTNTTPIGTGNPLTTTLTPGDHSITVEAKDSALCSATSAAVPVHINQPVSTSLNCGSTPDCTGHLTFTASATGGAGGYTFAWTVDGQPAGNSSNTLAYTPNVDCNPHTVAVTATDSAGCPSGNTASRTVTQVVSTTISGCP